MQNVAGLMAIALCVFVFVVLIGVTFGATVASSVIIGYRVAAGVDVFLMFCIGVNFLIECLK